MITQIGARWVWCDRVVWEPQALRLYSVGLKVGGDGGNMQNGGNGLM